MDKYKRLLSNTLIFAIGIFGSKLLSFLMMPYLTRVMNTQQFGQADLIFQAGNFLLPVVSLGITNSIIRFGLDKAVKKEEVFSTGILAVFFGFLVLLAVTPLLSMISFFQGNTLLICVFVLMSSLRSVCAQFTRAKGEVRLFAFDGILSTLTTIGFYVLFLSGLKWGATGYVLAMVCSDALSVVFLSIMVKLPRYVSVKKFSWNTSKEMLKYSVPMIPNSMFWWITNVSNRFMITHFLGTGANGLYSAASKIPTAISLVGDVFLNAWQISAVTEEKQRGKFFSRVFRSYSAVLFICAAVIILFSKVVTKILVADTYYESWKFIPLLTVAIVFSNLVTFLGSVYMVEKRSLLSLGTTVVGAVVNVVLNLLLIPGYGPNGAAFATLVSYFVVFILRGINATTHIKMRWNIGNLVLNGILLMAECMLMVFEVPGWMVWVTLLMLGVIAINLRPILKSVKQLLPSRRKA